MEGAKLAIMMVILMSTMLLGIVSATTHTVGGSSGWDLSSNLTDWSSSTSFFVNDSLVFLHNTQQNLIEVSKPEYDSCQIYNPIATYNNGDTDTVIFLNQPGPRYFVCSNQCTLGLKMQVQVLDDSSSQSPSSSPLPSNNSDSNSTTDLPGLPPIQLELPEISDHCNKHGRKRRYSCTQRGHPSNGYKNIPFGNFILYVRVLQGAMTITIYVIMFRTLLDIDYPKAITITGLWLMINIFFRTNVLVCLAIAVIAVITQRP